MLQQRRAGCGRVGSQESEGAQLVAELIDSFKTIDAKRMTGNRVSRAVTPTEFDAHAIPIAAKGQAQIKIAVPRRRTGFQSLARISVKTRRRRHSAKKRIDYHGIPGSFLLSVQTSNFPTIDAKFSRMRKTGVQNPHGALHA